MHRLVLALALLVTAPTVYAAEANNQVADQPTYTKFVLSKDINGSPSVIVLYEQMGGMLIGRYMTLVGVENDGLWKFEVPTESTCVPYSALLLDPQGEMVAVIPTIDGPELARVERKNVRIEGIGGGGALFEVHPSETRPIENLARILGP